MGLFDIFKPTSDDEIFDRYKTGLIAIQRIRKFGYRTIKDYAMNLNEIKQAITLDDIPLSELVNINEDSLFASERSKDKWIEYYTDRIQKIKNFLEDWELKYIDILELILKFEYYIIEKRKRKYKIPFNVKEVRALLDELFLQFEMEAKQTLSPKKVEEIIQSCKKFEKDELIRGVEEILKEGKIKRKFEEKRADQIINRLKEILEEV